MLPIPSLDFIPRIFRDKSTTETLSLTTKLDTDLSAWLADVKNIDQLLDVDRCPSQFLIYIGNMLNADAQTLDSDRTKRQKIYSAIQTHKRRGSWVDHAKIIMDAITGYDARRFVLTDSDDWIMLGDSDDPPYYWGTMGVDGIDDLLGLALIGDGTEVEIAGNIYIDCHYGILVSTLTAAQITQIVNDIATDIVPAYMRVYLGYVNVAGAFINYAGGTIG